jgi:hypothetical protein
VTNLHLPAKETVERAEAAVLETLVFGGLIATAFAAAIYDIGLWIGAWLRASNRAKSHQLSVMVRRRAARANARD